MTYNGDSIIPEEFKALDESDEESEVGSATSELDFAEVNYVDHDGNTWTQEEKECWEQYGEGYGE